MTEEKNQTTDEARKFMAELNDRFEKLDEKFRHYRTTAVAVSVTVIGVCGAAIHTINGLTIAPLAKSLAIGLLLVLIFLSVALQYFNTVGPKWVARAGLNQLEMEALQKLSGRYTKGVQDEYEKKMNLSNRRFAVCR